MMRTVVQTFVKFKHLVQLLSPALPLLNQGVVVFPIPYFRLIWRESLQLLCKGNLPWLYW